MGHAENGFFRMIFHRWIIGFADGWMVVGRNHRGWWVFAARMKFPAGEGELSVPEIFLQLKYAVYIFDEFMNGLDCTERVGSLGMSPV